VANVLLIRPLGDVVAIVVKEAVNLWGAKWQDKIIKPLALTCVNERVKKLSIDQPAQGVLWFQLDWTAEQLHKAALKLLTGKGPAKQLQQALDGLGKYSRTWGLLVCQSATTSGRAPCCMTRIG
jgi:hypothetical protein